MSTNDIDYLKEILKKYPHKSEKFIKNYIYRTESFVDAYWILHDLDITKLKQKQIKEYLHEYLDYLEAINSDITE